MNDIEYVRKFAEEHDDESFRVLVKLHMPMVYSVCLRRLNGDSAGAEEAAQAVFIVLAKKAGKIRNEDRLAGFLFRVAVNTVNRMIRSQQRRKKHEKEAAEMGQAESDTEDRHWEAIRPQLDTALYSLRPGIRDAMIVHYLEGKKQEEAARILGCTPQALAKRLEYGREKLRGFFRKKGYSIPAAMLTAFLGTRTVEAVPP